MRYLTAGEVVAINEAEVGPDLLADFGLLESAVLRSQQTVFGQDALPRHPFEDRGALPPDRTFLTSDFPDCIERLFEYQNLPLHLFQLVVILADERSTDATPSAGT